MKKQNSIFLTINLLIVSLLLSSCGKHILIEGENIKIEFNKSMHSRVIAKFDGRSIHVGNFTSSEYLTVAGKKLADFQFKMLNSNSINDSIGSGKLYTIMGESDKLRKTITAISYINFPKTIIYSVTYTNISGEELKIDSWTNNHYQINPLTENNGEMFWSYQSGSYDERPDWVLPLNVGFYQQNYMGMNSSDYGGGTPVSDIWNNEIGIGVGHLETVPKLVSLPVDLPDSSGAYLGIKYKRETILKSGESLNTFMTFVSVHKGDYFETLDSYRKLMIKRGIKFDEPPKSVYEPIWCAWGFQRDFSLDQITNALPKVAEMGYRWVVLDDGFQTAEGDWHLIKDKFPDGDIDMKKFVDSIHEHGMKAKLWWAPMAVDPDTDLIDKHEEYLLLNKDGSTQDITWWDSYYLCPAYEPVKDYTRELVKKFMITWGYDGLKIDGQHLNAAPPCYNPVHKHERPEESVEAVPEFFKVIYDTALEINSEAVVEICPCGTAYSFFNLPYMNQSVASDPLSSWQIRLKGKTLKALMGPSHAYYGDHVELSDGQDDWASTVGIGGVIGTKFTWPEDEMIKMPFGKPAKESDVALTAEKEELWKKWLKIYNDNMLPMGNYLGNLYDIGFDKPEAHVVEKDEKMYYSFYAEKFDGNIELRGLSNRRYKVIDYVNNLEIGEVNGPIAEVSVSFSQYLLIKAEPI